MLERRRPAVHVHNLRDVILTITTWPVGERRRFLRGVMDQAALLRHRGEIDSHRLHLRSPWCLPEVRHGSWMIGELAGAFAGPLHQT